MEGTHVMLTFGEPVDVLEAGVPYIIKWTEGDDIVNPVFKSVTFSAPEAQVIEKADGCVKFCGYYSAFDIDTPATNKGGF